MNKSEKLKKIRDGLVLLSREREVVLSFHETFHMVDELLEIVDDLTIRISTKKPNPFIPNDMSRIAIIDSAFVNATTEDFNTGVASFGTGPFKFSKWLPGDLIEIKRNNAYWGDKVKWDNIIIRPIKDGTTRTAALISGDVDFIERVPPSDLPNLEKRKGISVFKSVSNRSLYLTLHMTDNPRRPYTMDNLSLIHI